MTSTEPSATLLILGAHGDLTHRLLLPGLATLLCAEPDRPVRLIGSDRDPLTAEQWQAIVTDSFTTAKASPELIQQVVSTTSYVQGDVLDLASLQHVIAACGEGPLVIFFALPPAITEKACSLLAATKLPRQTRLALEKPFGTDGASAVKFNRQLQRVVPEDHIFRIDHFLGVSTVLNLIGLRFTNRLMMNIWDSTNIEKVEILYEEDLALEGRAGYYDHNGALRDMLQSHLLQVMAIFAWSPLPR